MVDPKSTMVDLKPTMVDPKSTMVDPKSTMVDPKSTPFGDQPISGSAQAEQVDLLYKVNDFLTFPAAA